MFQSNAPILSIIAITYRDVIGIRNTLKSLERLLDESGLEVEVLIQDGGTGADFDQIIREFGLIARIESRKDSGIYDAMNRGIVRSRGSYLWFLNGGDLCSVTSWEPLKELLGNADGSMVLGSFGLRSGSRTIMRRPRGMSYLWHGLPTSHQAILYPRKSVAETMYEPRFQIVGDYALTSRLYVSGISGLTTPMVLAIFKAGGTSQQHAKLLAKEARSVQREILGESIIRVILSSCIHFASRTRRNIFTKI